MQPWVTVTFYKIKIQRGCGIHKLIIFDNHWPNKNKFKDQTLNIFKIPKEGHCDLDSLI